MILKHLDTVLALTADDKLYEWKDQDPIVPKLIAESVAMLRMCPRYGQPTVLTHDGRILTALPLDTGFRDVTAIISNTLECDTALIQDIQVYGGIIAAITDDRISFSNLWFDRAYGAVRTRGDPSQNQYG